MFSSEQASIVHSNGSPQGSPLWMQVPSRQVSVPLQKMSSLHDAVLLAWAQPVAGVQFGSRPARSHLILDNSNGWPRTDA